ncbi:hypothetical protein CC1G_13827 [Coprinopsis cinerea okayama7|uniref:DUF6533 domain-containing protein n=1 Tax=Coprinopsis cinerea (strain Okayama-7 / 130 / ATCC MYA-4618 / FGSC 9003) TaxID=240176 RepID=D6RKF2_COPC7|nr:hypothetical protein CC1G_13827 [Coprinopsis cinerea okayama7\|eukprot:XP_002911792.1 hypothetical protein CC1G_13827 [Coprinopsis cinerea okayama7\
MDDYVYQRLVAQVVSSRYTNYCNVASLTVLILEYMQTFDLERSLIWPIKWNHVKLIYVINRYLPFPVVVALVYYNVAPPIFSERACKYLFSVPSMGIAVCILIADALLYIRLYALSGRTRPVKFFLLANVTLVVVVALTFFALYLAAGRFIQSPAPELAGCFGATSGAGKYVMICYATLLYSAIVTMGLSIWYGLKMYWSSRESHLIKVLYRDGAFYFITIAVMSIANGIFSIGAPARYRFLLAVPQAVMHNILATRMILHLRETARSEMGFSSDVVNHSYGFHATISRRKSGDNGRSTLGLDTCDDSGERTISWHDTPSR